MIEFYQRNRIDMLKLGCTSPNLANICLHRSTNIRFYSFPEGDKNLLEKMEAMVGGPSIVFTRKAVVGQTRMRSSSNTCKSIEGIDGKSYIPKPCVSRYRLGFIHIGNLMPTCSVSNLDPIKPNRLKT